MTQQPPVRVNAEVVANCREGDAGYRMRLSVAGWGGNEPGQFVMLSAGARSEVRRDDPLLPRPMAVYRSAPIDGGSEIEVLYKRVGRGTALMAEVETGDRVSLVGPLGRGFPDCAADKVAVLVGGGTGIASLYELAERESKQGCIAILGAQTGGELLGLSDFEKLEVDLRLTTEDGSLGERGLVTHVLDSVLADLGRRAVVYACGPTPMMRACADRSAVAGADCRVSLENNMACGFGVCLGCAVPVSAGGYALVCREGPVFDALDVAWEGLP